MRTENIRWDDLRIFLRVAKEGSLTAAAQGLNMSHTTVFRHVQELENELGVRVFDRTRAGYTLTDAGKELFEVASEMDAKLQITAHQLSKRNAWPGGIVRVTTSDTLMHQVLSPILTAYQKSASVQLHINTSTARLDIVNGEADVAIRAGGKPPEPLVGRRLCHVESTLYYPKKMRGVRLDNLDEYPWICADESLNHFESSKWLRQKGLQNAAVMVTNSRLNMLQLMRSGAGIGALACYLGDSDPTLTRLMPPPPEWRSDLWILTRAELRNVPRIKLLFDAVYQGIRPLVPLFEGDLAKS